MEPYERAQLADALTEVTVPAGQFIIREGDDGKDLFLLQNGTAIATKTLSPGAAPE